MKHANGDGGEAKRRALQTLVLFLLLVGSLSALVNCQQAPPHSKPVLDMHFASDSWWVSDKPALDSPASIRDAVQMWADVFHIKRVYWRCEEEEINHDYFLIRKENFP